MLVTDASAAGSTLTAGIQVVHATRSERRPRSSVVCCQREICTTLI